MDKSESPTHDLFEYMLRTTQEMAKDYELIQKRSSEDPGTAGDQGEENWAKLFRDWLPSYFPVVTKGRILSHEGKAGPQVDVLILAPSYPAKLLNHKYYLAGGVAAAFECKVTLKAHHIKEAVDTSVQIQRLVSIQQGSPYREIQSPLIFGLLAHSHSWKSAESRPVENIGIRLISATTNL